jgi:hypothetical protein
MPGVHSHRGGTTPPKGGLYYKYIFNKYVDNTGKGPPSAHAPVVSTTREPFF